MNERGCNSFLFQSAFGVGQAVSISMNGVKLDGNIRSVTFTDMKVRYSISICVNMYDDSTVEKEIKRTTFHNIDSVFIVNRDGDNVDFGGDNYS